MPELPEVETVKTALNNCICGLKIEGCGIFTEKLRYPFNFDQTDSFVGSRIVKFSRRARYLTLELDNGQGFLIHLGMSGKLRVVETRSSRLKHEHVVFNLENGCDLRFECPRKFGFIKYIPELSLINEVEELRKLGPEPLSDDFSANYLTEAIKNKNSIIKSVIMDNSIISGLGNIYASESLFAAGVSPSSTAANIPDKKIEDLVYSIKEIVKAAVSAGKRHVMNKKSVDGNEWKFPYPKKVYGLDGEKCCKCNKDSIFKCNIAGRASYFCKKCQIEY